MKKIIYMFAVFVFFNSAEKSFSQGAIKYRLDNGLILATEDAFTVGGNSDEFEFGLVNLYLNDSKFSNLSRGELKYGLTNFLEGKFGLVMSILNANEPYFYVLPVEATLKWNINDESESIPAISILAGINGINQIASPDLYTGTFKFIATKTFEEARMNLNVNYVTQLDENRFQFHRNNFQFGYSLDYMLNKEQTFMAMGEIYNYHENSYSITLGIRKVFSNAMAISGGAGTGFGSRRRSDIFVMFSITWLNGL